MPSTLVELRPDRKYLDPNFEGYKLSLQSVPHWISTLPSEVDKLGPSEDEYSLAHAKLFILHNHLVADNWNGDNFAYYIDDNWNVQRVSFDGLTKLFDITPVYQIPSRTERRPGHFNLCLSFPACDYAIISDGTGVLHIAYTDNRAKNSKLWNTEYSNEVLGADKYFSILHARLENNKDNLRLHCLLYSIIQTEKRFETVISWITLRNATERDESTWNMLSLKEITGKGVVHYAALERSLTAVYIVSDHPFKYIVDSENAVTEEVKKPEKTIVYTWLQTTEDITLTFQFSTKNSKEVPKVTTSRNSIKVSHSGTDYINGKLMQKIDSDLTTWNLKDDGKFDVLLTKSESSIWSELIEGGDENGEQIMDPSLVEEVHKRLAHLCSATEADGAPAMPSFSNQELEECDAPSEADSMLVRLDGTTHETTHRAPLSVHQHLFTTHLDPSEAPAICLRHDVDGCIWQPYGTLNDNQLWPIKHLGMLPAYGYIQSSKELRKYLTCSPDFSYSAIIEYNRHVFIYKSTSEFSEGCQLRQRSGNGDTRRIKVGQQLLFNLEDAEALGLHATNEFLYILTKKSIIALQI